MESSEAPSRSELAASHTPTKIRERLQAPAKHSYLRDFVYGAIDGIVTTFAVVSGVAGAGLSSGVIIILGMANLVGDGFSMAASNFLGTRTEESLRSKARRTEEYHIAQNPEGEREEIRQIFAEKGFKGEELEHVVDVITADSRRWVDTMLVEELNIRLEGPSAWKASLTTFLAFIFVGLVPLLAFLYNLASPVPVEDPYLASALLTGLAFFSVGAAKSRFVDESWQYAGFETLAVGGAAAALAYLAGMIFGGLVH